MNKKGLFKPLSKIAKKFKLKIEKNEYGVYRLYNDNITFKIGLLYIKEIIRIVIYLNNCDYAIDKREININDDLTEIEKIISEFIGLPQFIDNIKSLVINEIIGRNLIFKTTHLRATENFWYLEFDVDNEFSTYLELQFKAINYVSIYREYHKNINDYRLKLCYSIYDLPLNYEEIEKAVKTIMSIETQTNDNKEEQ